MAKCTDCGKTMTKEEVELNDICQECVQAIADDVDREALGDESFEYFKATGYFDDHDAFGDKS